LRVFLYNCISVKMYHWHCPCMTLQLRILTSWLIKLRVDVLDCVLFETRIAHVCEISLLSLLVCWSVLELSKRTCPSSEFLNMGFDRFKYPYQSRRRFPACPSWKLYWPAPFILVCFGSEGFGLTFPLTCCFSHLPFGVIRNSLSDIIDYESVSETTEAQRRQHKITFVFYIFVFYILYFCVLYFTFLCFIFCILLFLCNVLRRVIIGI
jgi:hypothetical protein